MTLLSTLTAQSENRIEAAIVLSTYLPLIEELDEVRCSWTRELQSKG